MSLNRVQIMFIAIELVKRTWRVGYIRAYNRIEDEHDLNNHSMNQVYNAVSRAIHTPLPCRLTANYSDGAILLPRIIQHSIPVIYCK